MKHKYQIFKIKGKKFIVKLDYNELTKEYDYHMYIRHLITPQQAIAAYFTKTTEIYNKDYNRFEAYSQELNIMVYYTYLKKEDILLITAFSYGGLYE